MLKIYREVSVHTGPRDEKFLVEFREVEETSSNKTYVTLFKEIPDITGRPHWDAVPDGENGRFMLNAAMMRIADELNRLDYED